jgi:diaminopimelate epimerase
MVEPARFDKYEGLGNDFIVFERLSLEEMSPARAVALCDRRRGVGADGVLLVLAPQGSDAVGRMHVVNADGSTPEMCGNGLRCVAFHLHRRARAASAIDLPIETDAGIRSCHVDPLDARSLAQAIVTVDMGVVRWLGDRTTAVAGRSLVVSVADVGNPHAVLFGSFSPAEIQEIGPALATAPDFPHGTNVEFARPAAEGIELVVWERGVGLTLACGTGACATAAVACAKGLARAGELQRLRLPGGALEVSVDAGGRATMRGPARHVFSGEVLL